MDTFLSGFRSVGCGPCSGLLIARAGCVSARAPLLLPFSPLLAGRLPALTAPQLRRQSMQVARFVPAAAHQALRVYVCCRNMQNHKHSIEWTCKHASGRLRRWQRTLIVVATTVVQAVSVQPSAA